VREKKCKALEGDFQRKVTATRDLIL